MNIFYLCVAEIIVKIEIYLLINEWTEFYKNKNIKKIFFYHSIIKRKNQHWKSMIREKNKVMFIAQQEEKGIKEILVMYKQIEKEKMCKSFFIKKEKKHQRMKRKIVR